VIHAPKQPAWEPPIVVEVFADSNHEASFVPKSRIRLGSSFRQLAATIPADRLRDLLILITFTTANGRLSPSAPDIAGALGLAVWQARLRLYRLSLTMWQGQPLVRGLKHPGGLTTFSPSPQVLEMRQELPPAAALPSDAPTRFEQVVQASREQYSRPREEVEREITARQGWPSAEEMEAARLSRETEPTELNAVWAANRLSKAGVDYGLALKLIRQFGAEACIQQVAWIEYRSVKNKARYLVAAIQKSYAKPPDAPIGSDTSDPDPSLAP